jgi:uncharacterized protein YndB with AHSA1/START domain
MERKTKINAEDGQQQLVITREFDLPLELLFKAYVEADIVEQWMGTKVLKLENKRHGSYQFETTMVSVGQYMSLSPTRRLQGHLKWKTLLLVCSLSFLNLKD